MDAILEVKGLTKKYEKSDFQLDNVTFSLPKGAIMGFIGENGSGKTTTINCILGTLIKDSGTVKIFGQEMKNDSINIRDNIGVVFDENVFSNLLSAKQIANVMRDIYTNWNDALFVNYLEKFNLPFDKKIKTYSRGMMMKLGLAVALSHQPKLLILDEATSGLDPIVRDEVLDILLDFVQDENHSVLLSSHITSDLEKIADYIMFIHDGKVILNESKDELIYHYGVMRCKGSQFEDVDKGDVLAYRKRDYQIDMLVVNKRMVEKKYGDFIVDDVSIEEMMLILVKGERE